MSSSENSNEGAGLEGDFQQAFAAYQQEFKAALERSAEALHNAIAAAQQSMTEQLGSGFPPPLKLTEQAEAQMPGKPVADEPGDPAFVQAGAVFHQVELASPIQQATLAGSPANLPQPGAPSLSVPNDLAAASDLLMSQAVESLNAAMKTALEVMLKPPKGAGEK